MLYHVSPQQGLTVLEPRVSTHGKAWVYALADEVTALLFGARQDDFDLCIDSLEDGRTEVWECWDGAFLGCYSGKSCSVYQLAEQGFLSGQTSWSPEQVCPHLVPVLGETIVPDLYERLQQEEAAGRVILRRWREDESYQAKIRAHIVDRLERFGILQLPTVPPRIWEHHRAVIESMRP